MTFPLTKLTQAKNSVTYVHKYDHDKGLEHTIYSL